MPPGALPATLHAPALDPEELARKLDEGETVVVLDVREAWEVDLGTLPNTLWIPLDELAARIEEVPTDREVVCVCHHGVRSAFAARALAAAGHPRVFNLRGGVDRWHREVDGDFPTY